MSKGAPSHWLWGLLSSFALIGFLFGPDVATQIAGPEKSGPREFHGRAALMAVAGGTLPSAREVAPLEWLAVLKGERIKLSGSVASTEDRVIVLGMVKAMFPDLQLDERIKIADEKESDDVWLSGVSYALKQLKGLMTGSAKVSGRNVSIAGTAASGDDFRALRTVAASELPSELRLAQMDIAAPRAEPFTFSVEHKGGKLAMAGHVPSEEARKTLIDSIKAKFPGKDIADETELASGAPERWIVAVKQGLHSLSRLSRGTLAAKGQELVFTGVAPDDVTAQAVSAELRRSLPKSYRARQEVVAAGAGGKKRVAMAAVAGDAQVTGSIPDPFSWRAERRPGFLTLGGDVPSETARRQLLAAVRVGYPGSVVEDRMVVSPGAPGRWLDAAALSVEQLGRLEEGYVFMNDRSLSIVGRLNPGEDVAAFERSFAEALPIGFRGSHALAVQRPEEVEKAERCQSMIDEVLGENAISFHGGSAKVLSESEPVLKQLARIAGTCPGSVIEVAARPDAGADPIDRDLVRERAQSVLDYLADAGAHNARLAMHARMGGAADHTDQLARLRIELHVRVN